MPVNQAELLDLCIKALWSALAFCSAPKTQLQPANILALRYVEGQLPLLRYEIAMTGGLEQRPLEEELSALAKNASLLADQAFAAMSRTPPPLALTINNFLRQPVVYYPNKRSIESSKRWRMAHDELLRDPRSVEEVTLAVAGNFSLCVSEANRLLQYAGKDVDDAGVECGNVSEICTTFWLRERRLLSSHLSARIFLTSALQQALQCKSYFDEQVMKLRYRFGVDDLLSELCSNLFYILEHRIIAKRSSEKQDIMIWIMQLACGHAGFKEFLRLSWLLPILHLQDSSGCFVGDELYDDRHIMHNERSKCDMTATAIATSLLVCYARCLSMGDCDVTDGFGRPVINYDPDGVNDGTQVNLNSPWSNRTLLEQLDMLSSMQVRFKRINDITLYWFALAAVIFFVLTVKMRSRDKNKIAGVKEKL